MCFQIAVTKLCLAPLNCLRNLEHSTSAEANSYPVSQEIPCALWTMKLHITYTRTCHQILFCARLIPSTPTCPVSSRYISVLCPFYLGLLGVLCHSAFLIRTLYYFCNFPHLLHALSISSSLLCSP